jgi:uncharacterized repeat protein (TIGR03803 family)
MKTKNPSWHRLLILMTGFALILAGQAAAQTFTNLHNFSALDPATQTTNTDGANPYAGLVLSGNILYGTAQSGGTNGSGTLFKVKTDGTGFTNLYNFTALDPNTFTNSDGANPVAALILSGNILYGTTSGGGSSDNGTVFRVNIAGTGFTNVYDFTGGDDGGYPDAGLVLSGSTLYGTAYFGGTNGVGSVFAVNTDGTGFTNLHSFTAGEYDSSGYYTNSDGAYPQAGLLLAGGTLYGTAYEGGTNGVGTVFAVATTGTGFMNLHSFAALIFQTNSDGANPAASLILSGSTLYGTASLGGTNSDGTVFAVNTNGSGFTTLHNCGYNDGANPLGGLILSGNILYGTAEYGGSSGDGTVFAIKTDGTGFADIYGFNAISFPAGTNNDGANPTAGLVLSGGTLYGTAQSGGTNGDGTVFSVSTNITVQACSALQIITKNLPNGVANVYYDQFLLATSCIPSFTWALQSGSLPPGLQLSPAGELSGTPTNGGVFNFSVSVGDGNDASTNQALTLEVISPTPATISHPTVSSGYFQFTLNDANGQNLTVQFSTNLINWVNLFSTNFPGGSFICTLSPPTNQDGFYRVLESGLVIADSWLGTFSTAPVVSPSNYVSLVDVPDSKVTVSILRSGGFGNQVCVDYATADGTARAGVDYAPVSGTVCFDPNQTNASITIPLLINSNSPGSETLDLILFDPNRTTVLNTSILLLFPQLLGTWYGNWAGTNGALICGGGAIPVPPPYGGGTWTLVMHQVDWPDRTAQGTLFMQGNEYARGITNNCALCCLTELFPAYQTSQIVSNIVVDSSGRVTIGSPTSSLGHGDGFLVSVDPPGPDLGVDFEFDTINEVVQGSFTSEYGSIVGGATTNGAWSHVGWVSGERISPTH